MENQNASQSNYKTKTKEISHYDELHITLNSAYNDCPGTDVF